METNTIIGAISLRMYNGEIFASGDIDLKHLREKGEKYVEKIKHKDGEHGHIRISLIPLSKERRTIHQTHLVVIETEPRKNGKGEEKKEEISAPSPAPIDQFPSEQYDDDLPF